MAKYLDGSGVTYLWQKIKAAFAAIDHNHNGTYVDAASSTTSGHVVTFGANGHTIADSGFTILQNVPAASTAGFISTADQTKLNGIEAGAEVNIIEGVQVNGADLTPDANRKVNVVIPAATVTGVKSGEKVISLDGTELQSTISLDIEHPTTGADAGKTFLVIKGISDEEVAKVDASEFVKDGMLNYAQLHVYDGTSWSPALPSGTTAPAGTQAGTYIVLVWNTDSEKSAVFVNVTDLIDIYTAGNGLQLSSHEFSVKTDNTTSPTEGSSRVTLTAGASGLRAEIDLSGKVDKVEGKQLSTEDYTTTEKTKLSGIETGAQVNVIETVKVDGTALSPDVNKAVNINLSGKADKVASATSGNFAGLDANGNLTDSGSKASDFATSNHNHDSVYVKKESVTVPATEPTAAYGTSVEIGTVDGKSFKFTMPAAPAVHEALSNADIDAAIAAAA